MTQRDRAALGADPAIQAPPGLRAKWQSRLTAGNLSEAEALDLLADYGIPVVPHVFAKDEAAALAAAEKCGYPVVMKTAMPGILHKSDVGGVKLSLADAAAMKAAYADLSARLGPRVLIMPMMGKGTEISFGMTRDEQFGPVVMIGAGGVLIEMMKDRRFVLPPFGVKEARWQIDKLSLRPLLDGKRGAKPADIDALAKAFSAFSVMVADLDGLISEIDVNPLIVNDRGAVAVDALIVKG